jgi:8-oxo-dGTP pyrophosphatase MutT (NUDIX family)
VVEHTIIEESITIDVFDEPMIDPVGMPAETFVEPLAPLTPRAPKPHVIRIAAAVVTDLAGRSLLVRKHGSTIFMQPGGKIESGESALAALTRELREELGLVVDPGETEYIGSYRAIAANEENTVIRAEVFFLTTPELPVAGAEIAELLWVERLDEISVEVAPLSRDSLLPLWASRRPTLF